MTRLQTLLGINTETELRLFNVMDAKAATVFTNRQRLDVIREIISIFKLPDNALPDVAMLERAKTDKDVDRKELREYLASK